MGGKSAVAHLVWRSLGQPGHYIEPFFGSGAVLLARPNWQPTMTETVNDADGHLANVWRSLQFSPDETARWCDWPVNHADLMARKAEMIRNEARLLEGLCADPKWHDPVLAGYWIWAASCWIGSGLTRPGSIPRLSDAGAGVQAKGQIPHLTNAGMGVHAKGKIPHLAHTGMGVQDPYNTNIYAWFKQLSERLRNVRVVCGDWSRVCGGDWQDKAWGTVGVFFDPPYGAAATRDPGIYNVDSLTVAQDVQEWALERGDRPNYRIAIAGYYEEHENLLSHGWTVHKWKTAGGYGRTARNGNKTRGQDNRHREALFFSPHCLKWHKQEGLFA